MSLSQSFSESDSPSIEAVATPNEKALSPGEGTTSVVPMNAHHEAHVRNARRLVNRVLPGWASDVLSLRRKRLLDLRWPATRLRGPGRDESLPLAA